MKTVLIGDRLTCAGYRLAGVATRLTDGPGVAAAFDAARTDADLVLITAPLADQLRADTLDRAIRLATPPVQVIPPVTNPQYAPDVRQRVRRSLGVST